MTKAQWFKRTKQDFARVNAKDKHNVTGQVSTKAAKRGLQRLKELGL